MRMAVGLLEGSALMVIGACDAPTSPFLTETMRLCLYGKDLLQKIYEGPERTE